MDATSQESAPITVFLLDDHEIVRIGVADLIDNEPDMEVVGQADEAAEAVRMIGSLQPDVALLDVRLQAGNGIEVCRQVTERHPNVACVMLTSFDDDHALLEAAEAGAAAFVLKQVRRNEIVSSIRKVAGGAVLLDAATVRMGRQRLEGDEETQLEHLTDQERRVFDLIGEGCTNRQIAEQLFVAEKTVKNYVTSMLAKLNLHRRTEAAAMAARIEERDRQRYQ